MVPVGLLKGHHAFSFLEGQSCPLSIMWIPNTGVTSSFCPRTREGRFFGFFASVSCILSPSAIPAPKSALHWTHLWLLFFQMWLFPHAAASAATLLANRRQGNLYMPSILSSLILTESRAGVLLSPAVCSLSLLSSLEGPFSENKISLHWFSHRQEGRGSGGVPETIPSMASFAWQ